MARSISNHGGKHAIWGRAGWASAIVGMAVSTAIAAARAGDDPPPVAPDGVPDSSAARTANGSRMAPPAESRVTLVESTDNSHVVRTLKRQKTPTAITAEPAEDAPIARALRLIGECQARYQTVDDYTCTFYKRERVDGNLTPLHIMSMKVRSKPQSIYFKFQRPARGREAIYISGRHNGKILAHDVGFNKFIAGTLELEPTCSRAMEENRHPITEAGIGPLIDTVARRWAAELRPEESKVTFRDDMLVGSRRALMIESVHPHRRPQFLFHMVRVYIDHELGLPVRFEAYDWPKLPHAEPELAEEYTYGDIRLNVGLQEIDFDIANKEYAFGRF